MPTAKDPFIRDSTPRVRLCRSGTAQGVQVDNTATIFSNLALAWHTNAGQSTPAYADRSREIANREMDRLPELEGLDAVGLGLILGLH